MFKCSNNNKVKIIIIKIILLKIVMPKKKKNEQMVEVHLNWLHFLKAKQCICFVFEVK